MFTFMAIMAEDVNGAPKWYIPMGMVMDFIGAMAILYVTTRHD